MDLGIRVRAGGQPHRGDRHRRDMHTPSGRRASPIVYDYRIQHAGRDADSGAGKDGAGASAFGPSAAVGGAGTGAGREPNGVRESGAMEEAVCRSIQRTVSGLAAIRKTSLDAIDLLRIPYVPYWSFGERLPAIEEGVSDPASLGHAYEILARVLAARLDWYAALEGQTLAPPPAPKRRELDPLWFAPSRPTKAYSPSFLWIFLPSVHSTTGP